MQIYQQRHNKGPFQGQKCGGLQLMEGQYGGGALPCLCNEGPDYVMSLMSTYGTSQRNGKETTREWVDGSGNSQKN